MNPMFERMTSRLFDICIGDWSPMTQTSDPAIWHKREWNQIADFLVNLTMGSRQDWQHDFKPTVQNFKLNEASVIFHSDGGTRGSKCSAAAWIMEAIVTREDKQYTFPVAARGIYLPDPVSSFLAEALALDDAISYFSKSVRKRS